MDMKPAGQPEQAGCGEWLKSRVLRMMVRRFICNVNDTRGLIGLFLLVTSHLGQIRDPLDRQVFTIAHIVISPSLHVYGLSLMHLFTNSLKRKMIFFFKEKSLFFKEKSIYFPLKKNYFSLQKKYFFKEK